MTGNLDSIMIDEAMQAGEVISDIVKRNQKLFPLIIEYRKYTDMINEGLKSLKIDWKIVLKYDLQYPNSQYITKAKQNILEKANQYLTPEQFQGIYSDK